MDEETKSLNENPQKPDGENKSAISADLIRGHINTIILRTLYERDKYGYEIIEEIENKSHGQYSLKQPTLYSALKRLENQGYINAYWKTDEVSQGGRRKYYTLTDTGREITERNQAEWEYSRTVIDNLISDRSFDFSKPAPNSVDFKILKKSTSRVPVVKDSEDYYDNEDDEEDIAPIPKLDVKPETITYTEEFVLYEEDPAPTPVESTTAPAPVVEPAPAPVAPVQVEEPAPRPPVVLEPIVIEREPEPIVREVVEEVTRVEDNDPPMDEEQRRIVHENYLRLISEPVRQPEPEVEEMPVADEIDTEKLIYNNKPETERDYRNLINHLFVKTVKNKPKQETDAYVKKAARTDIEDIKSKANSDGLKINSSDYVISSARRKSYNRGSALIKCSLIVFIVMLLEFTLCILFKNELHVSLAYPFVLFALAVAQLLIFGVLYYTDLGKSSRKPSSTLYLSACIITTIILIFIIFIVSLLIGVNFASAGSIMSRLIIPCLVALNIPAFAVCFYLFSK